MASFGYVRRVTEDDTLEIDDVKNCTIKANSDMGDSYYLTISTDNGWSTVLECGPISDIQIPGKARYITWNYSYMPADSRKISKIIEVFLNNPRRAITQAEVCEYDDIKNELINPLDLIEEI